MYEGLKVSKAPRESYGCQVVWEEMDNGNREKS